MEQEKIRELLGKYFAGETSEEEELMLRKYLGNHPVPGNLSEEFGYLAAEPSGIPEPSEGFEAMLDSVTRTGIIFTPKPGRWLRFAGIGAAVAVITGIWLFLSTVSRQHTKDTYTDPAIAMAEVKSILLAVSERMNTGTAQLEQVRAMNTRPQELNNLSDIKGIVGKNLSRLRYLGELQPADKKTETE